MPGNYLKRGEVIAAIAVLLLSALFVAGSSSALTPDSGNISFVLMYKDAETGNSDLLGNVEVFLFDMNGSYIKNTTSRSNGIVVFEDVEYGNYVIRTDTVRVGDYLYKANLSLVELDDSGQHLIGGGDFTNLTVLRYPLDHYLNITVMENGKKEAATVNIYFNATKYCFQSGMGESQYNFTVPFGTLGVEVIYNEGGVNKTLYKDITIPKNQKYNKVVIDVDNYKRIMGTVTSNTKIVESTVHITLINATTGNVWKILNFSGGAFSFYLNSTNYKMVVTADGYDISPPQYVSTDFMNIKLNPAEDHQRYTMVFSEDMKWLNVTRKIEISNETVLYSLPYNNTGVLYYQLKLLGWSEDDLKNYLINEYPKYTDKLITVDGNIYEFNSVDPASWTGDSHTENYVLTQTIHYKNSDISKSSLLKDKKIDVRIYAGKDEIKGAQILYNYTLQIPSDMERSNEISNAEVVNYTGDISISKVNSLPVLLILKERKNPEITLDKLVVGWENITHVNHVVNQSADNYTIVVPAHKDVWFNASRMVYDAVRDVTDAENTTYNWTIDGKNYKSGKGLYNITYKFSTGKHLVRVDVTDVGGNTNETNVTVLADSYWPTVNITIKTPNGKKIATLHTDEASMSKIDYNISGKKGGAWRNSTSYVVTIKTPLIVNQSEEIVYTAGNSTDTYDGKNLTHLPVIVEWDFNGNKTTGLNKTFAFDKPTRNGTYYVNVTLRDSVNNTIIISIPVEVKDITKPVVRLNFTVDGKNVNEVKEEENVTLDATGTYDPDNGTIASYNWTIKNETYKVINETSGLFSVINGSFSGNNVTLVFHKYGTYYIILNVTDGAGNYNVINRTLRVTPVRPDMTINSVDVSGDRVEGNKLTFEINVSNSGNAPAQKYWIAIYVNGNIVENKSLENLKNGSYVVKDLYWTPNSPGQYDVKIVVWCPNEPSSYRSDNVKEMSITIQEAPWKLPAIIIGSIIIIGFVGYIGWKYAEKKKEGKKFKKKSKGKKEKEKKE